MCGLRNNVPCWRMGQCSQQRNKGWKLSLKLGFLSSLFPMSLAFNLIFNIDASVKENAEYYTREWILRDSRGHILSMFGGFLENVEILHWEEQEARQQRNRSCCFSLSATVEASDLLEHFLESLPYDVSSIVIACDSAKAVEKLKGVEITYEATREILSSAVLSSIAFGPAFQLKCVMFQEV